MNTSIEDYLRVLYRIYENQKNKEKGIKSVEVAEMLGISKPSVSAMIRKIMKKRYLRVSTYSRIHLTKKGLQEARRVMHNHRVIEVFLKEILKYNIEDVHEEAHKLEHAFSKESIMRLDRYLKNPKMSPHGIKIPH
ncbi:metal-dependent transcriptional regulator [Nanoarchaeota archaeon]